MYSSQHVHHQSSFNMGWTSCYAACNEYKTITRADSRFAPSQWETALLCNDISHWLGANLESALVTILSEALTKWPSLGTHLNILRPRQNCRRFTDDIFVCILLNENAWISLKISQKFVPEVQINNIPALVQIMAWRRPGDKPFSEPMMVRLLKHWHATK